MIRPSDNRRLSNFQIGLIAIVVTVAAFYLAFAKSIPFTGEGYTLKAVFEDAQSIRVNSPVRAAGVDVGKVTQVEHLRDENGDGADAAVITMKIDDEGRPVREDVQLQLRPRLFLEGNLFVDMQPGSPGADELESGSVIPLEQTAISVQFDQVLTSLQKPVRDQLQVFLKEFGDALDRYGGAEGFRESFRTSPAAYRSTAQVNEALLGTEPGDLAGFVRNFAATIRALNQNQQQLKDLVTNLRVVSGSFAAESDALEQAIIELPQALEVGRPALRKLNSSLPALRAFSREILPGVRAANKALDDANPWIAQLRALVSTPELRGLVKDLRPTIPDLASLAQETVPFLEESRALSSCFNQVVIPWSNLPVPTAEPGAPQDPVFKQTGFSLTGVAGESRSGDAQGEWFRVLGGGGINTVSFNTPDLPGGTSAGVVPFEILGAQPARQTAAKTPFRPDAPCENQELPDLRTGAPVDVPESKAAKAPADSPGGRLLQLSDQYARIYTQMLRADSLDHGGASDQAEQLRLKTAKRLRDFNRTMLPEYYEALAQLTGGGR